MYTSKKTNLVTIKRFQNPEFKEALPRILSGEILCPDFFSLDRAFIVTDRLEVEMSTGISGRSIVARGSVKEDTTIKGMRVVFKDGSDEFVILEEIRALPQSPVTVSLDIAF